MEKKEMTTQQKAEIKKDLLTGKIVIVKDARFYPVMDKVADIKITPNTAMVQLTHRGKPRAVHLDLERFGVKEFDADNVVKVLNERFSHISGITSEEPVEVKN